MDNLISYVLNKKIVGVFNNYLEKYLTIFFEDSTELTFLECAIVINSGIIGHTISYASHSGTLGVTIELKKMGQNPEEYLNFIMSRDIEDFNNKNELIICYKRIKLQRPS